MFSNEAFITGLMFDPEHPPRPVLLQNTKEAVDKMFGRNTRANIPWQRKIVILADPTSKDRMNRLLVNDDYSPIHMTYGSFLAVGYEPTTMQYCSLSSDSIKYLMDSYYFPDKIIEENGTFRISKKIIKFDHPSESDENKKESED